jgi:GNAT superfamily N-acetyltransferase
MTEKKCGVLHGVKGSFIRTIHSFCFVLGECWAVGTKENGSEELEGSRNFSVAWMSIVIGEANARGKGIGKIAMTHLETLARVAGAKIYRLRISYRYSSLHSPRII